MSLNSTLGASCRLDQGLVALGVVPSRAKAQEMIESGFVEILTATAWELAKSASIKNIWSLDNVRLNDTRLLKYVSRGGLKLEGALEFLGLQAQGFRCLDVGLSTGGFADCLLQRGASQVIGIDVGSGQLAESLNSNSRLQSFEGVNVRQLRDFPDLIIELEAGFDLIVVDVSFISLEAVLPEVVPWLRPGGQLLALVKPQFEVGRQGIGKKGLVKEASSFDMVEIKVKDLCRRLSLLVKEYFACPVKGRDGNQEYFIYAIRTE